MNPNDVIGQYRIPTDLIFINVTLEVWVGWKNVTAQLATLLLNATLTSKETRILESTPNTHNCNIEARTYSLGTAGSFDCGEVFEMVP